MPQAVRYSGEGAGWSAFVFGFYGVLHHENCFWHPRRGAYLVAPSGYTLFQHVHLLESLLEPFPTIQIVLSTSWLRRYGYSWTAKRLSPKLRARVIGATFHTKMDERYFTNLPRGQQVYEDVLRRKPLAWVALDDNTEGWPDECLENFVRTHEQDGIADAETLARLVERLRWLGSAGIKSNF